MATKDTKSLAGMKPSFAVFFDGDESTLYQIAMWIKPFENVGQEWIIITRRPSMAGQLQAMTKKAKVVIARDRDKLIEVCNLPTLKFIMYVNNARENTEVVRFPHLVHAQLMHGDSEKTASFNPVSGMFTKIFVAGQAGVDRYARNGVKVAADKFEIVGRPQLGGMNVAEGPVNPKKPTVLVAPTWGGSALGEELSSLSVTPQIVEALTKAGASVIYRPHPFCSKTSEGAHTISVVHEMLEQHANKTGIKHVFGAAAETEITVNQAANLSDMIVSDLSGIMSDWLFSLKPYLLVSMDQTAQEFTERYPMAKTGVVLDGRAPADFEPAILRLLNTDTQATYDARKEMREYYLAGAENDDRAALFNSVVNRIISEA
ncbi:CDP-glycerol glycerophosphotransferase family protein [uncultured Aurantimicrobium sp.]|uniref:CDP-glycerol glycerophosphotransferase family protein n=1 Tax=uncultured Aurantimicrobium sp. TaxID=1705357 RepID=UPI002612CA84|nr:CDP-glycerol glycerophosphotransferase family protein [uncultured Aurantimicrobium sp.]